MKLLANIFTILMAVIQTGIMILEIFFWDPKGGEIFLLTPEATTASTLVAMNLGLYNGFIAAGLFWGFIKSRIDITVFFLSFVVIAAIFGAVTVKPTIILSQGAPAIIALIFVLLSSRSKSE